MKNYVFLLIISFFSLQSQAQTYNDSVLFFNGKSYKCEVTSVTEAMLNFKTLNRSGKEINVTVPKYEVISFTKNYETTRLYKKIEEIGNLLEYNEAKRYAIGGYDARKTYKPKHVFWTSLGLSYGISVWDTYLTKKAFDPIKFPDLKAGFFGKGPTLIPFVAPLILTASFGLPNVRVRKKHMLHTHMLNDNMYYNGFNNVARQRKAFSALKGSAIGIGLGLITYSILKIN